MGRIKIVSLLIILVVLGSCSATHYGTVAFDSQQIGEYYKAIENYKKANRKEKKNRDKRAEYVFQTAECYRRIGDYERAAIYYKNAIRRNYPDMNAFLHYADVLRVTQKFEEALENYRIYLDSIPDDQIALNGIESIKKTQEWIGKPTRFIVNPIKEINSRESDFSPVFVGGRDNEIIFTSTRKAATGKKKSMITGQKYADLFKAEFGIQKQKWDTPILLDQNFTVNTIDEEGVSSLSPDGSQMWFTRCRYDKTQNIGSEIYSSSQSKGTWSMPVSIDIFSDSIVQAQPALSPDLQKIYFVSDIPGGYGGKDIWMAENRDGKYMEPKNLGPNINTPGDEMFPYVRDNGELYFSSNYMVGMGGFDIFKATKDASDNWMVQNMGSPINSPGDDFGISFVEKKDQGMFSSNRKGSRGDDIYSFVLPPKIFEVTGEIFNRETNSHLTDASVRIIGSDGTNIKMRAQNGKFEFKLNPETEYVFAGFREGFLNDKARESTIGLDESKTFKVNLYLTPTDAPVKLENINYEFNSYELKPESVTALDSLINLLKLNPTIVVEIMAHTDHVGGDQYNFDLSQKRAQSAVDYLISKGVNSQRLVAKGYGETWPKKVTRDLARQYSFLKRDDVLTEEFINKLETQEQKDIAMGLNRRTEFRVISNDFHEQIKE